MTKELCAHLLIDRKGGICACEGDEIAVLPLPVAGLMTTLRPEEVAEKHNELKYFTSQLGCMFKAPETHRQRPF
ncbi:MAG: hypothetical protein IKY66_02425 [Bacteroidales bacterium]|nr:hypothetical protein [Bacteroidales bacterium]